MDNWEEIKTAYQVARLGTVSGAAEVLNVHHATVIRHIDALEKRLGEKLFHRHARGYTATEAGRDLLAVARSTEDHFIQLANRIRNRAEIVSGDLTVTSIPDISGQLTRLLVKFQADYPKLTLHVLCEQRLLRLEHGEADVAIRAGAPPSEPDYVVQPFLVLHPRLYASPAYIAAHGIPKTDRELANHRFVITDDDKSPEPYYCWLRNMVPASALHFRANNPATVSDAIGAGAGLGFLSCMAAAKRPDLIEVMPPRPEWSVRLWLVTHVDLHRTFKVQCFLSYLKEVAATWQEP